MRNIFELSEEEKNKIRGLHESYKSKPGTKIIWEQTEDVTLNKLNEKIKNVLLSNKNKVYQNVTVTISPKGNGISLEFASQTNPNNTSIIDVPASGVQGVYEKKVSNFNVTFKTLKLSEVYSEIFDNDPTLNQLYNNDNSVKSQMDNAFVPLYIYSENNGRISASNNENNRKNRKSNKFVEGDVTTLDKFYNNAGADFGVGNSIISVGFGNIISDLGEIKINKTGPVTPPNPNTKIVDEFSFTLTDPFEFDEDVLTSEGKNNLNFELEKLYDFIQICFDKGKLNQILDTNVVVKGFASSDGDPSSNQIGKLQACQNTKTRGEYDKCLSQKRADLIAKTLNNYLSNIEVEQPTGKVTVGSLYQRGVENWANPIGVGQDSSKTGIDWKTPHKSSDTAKDRRVEFTPTLSIKN